jgi:hypothetical protein
LKALPQAITAKRDASRGLGFGDPDERHFE